MPSPLLPPPPLDSALAQEDGKPGPAWGRWFQHLWDRLHGASSAARLIVATSASPTADFGSLEKGDRVLVIPAAAGNSHFVTIAMPGTLPEAAVIGHLYVVLRRS
jgi:hypothetical protein